MAELTLDEAPTNLRNLFNKGAMALEKGNLDYAMEMLAACIDQEPRLLKARKLLRAAALKKFRAKKVGALGRKLGEASRMPAYMSAQRLLKAGKPLEAMVATEKLLRDDPANIRYALLLADAAIIADMLEVGIMSVEVARDHAPQDPGVLEAVGDFYIKAGRPREARASYETLCQIRPGNPDFVKKLKDSMAMDSISNDGWEAAKNDGGSFHKLLKNEEEATQLERGKKAVKSDRDADLLIEEMRTKIESDPGNINYYRQLARLLSQKHNFEGAIETLTRAIEMNPADAELDRTLSETKLQEMDWRLENARNSGASDDEIVAIENERLEFRFSDLQSKVGKYPNDLTLKFEWGVMLQENDYFNEAIQQFQVAQRNPKIRLRALYQMGLCFKEKGQTDLAISQLETAASEMPIMDGQKKDILYELGQIASGQGDKAKALGYFKQIYSVDIGYRDIAQLVEQGG